ncbi:MAG: thiopurine S-methyltransferase [Methylococcales bacterium]|jgi:thiopurine S-methyltransferase|nr:thiopurine S-methyltransferase [Methylococcales bacterium]
MNTEFWIENWKKNKIGFHQQKINSHLISFWKNLTIAPSSHVFVPLCGKSLDLLWLSEQGHNVIGIEISELAVFDFFAENKLTYSTLEKDNFYRWEAEQLTIWQGDFFNLTANHLQDVEGVFDRASLVALPIVLREKYARHLKQILPAKAKILLVTFEYQQSEMNGPPFSVHESEVHELYADHYQIKLLLKKDVLTDYPQFQNIGVKNLQEKIYLLEPYY